MRFDRIRCFNGDPFLWVMRFVEGSLLYYCMKKTLPAVDSFQLTSSHDSGTGHRLDSKLEAGNGSQIEKTPNCSSSKRLFKVYRYIRELYSRYYWGVVWH